MKYDITPTARGDRENSNIVAGSAGVIGMTEKYAKTGISNIGFR